MVASVGHSPVCQSLFSIKEQKPGRCSRPSVTITVQPQDGGSTHKDVIEILDHALQNGLESIRTL